MKNYKVTITYIGREVFALTARNNKEAELKALQFFREGEPSNIRLLECLTDTPTSVGIVVVSETVDLLATNPKPE